MCYDPDYINRTSYSKDELDDILNELIDQGLVEKLKNRFQATEKAIKLRECNLQYLTEVQLIEEKI